jgi:uncharacterized protein YdeI (YjbR/CyaY-like superfamily)
VKAFFYGNNIIIMVKVESSVDDFFIGLSIFHKEANLLRKIALGCKLKEEVKWGGPVYTYERKNIVGIGVFKSYCGLWFFKGAALKDELNVLVTGSEKTYTQKQWRFTKIKEIDTKAIKAYILEAIAIEQSGVKLKVGTKTLVIDSILQLAFEVDATLYAAWSNLSLSCKREYTDYINEAKKEETKIKRIEKIKPMILSSKGLNDKYK